MVINFTGDIALQKPNDVVVDKQLADIFIKADYNVAGFEVPITAERQIAEPKSGPSLSQSSETVELLKSLKFNVFALANNHIFDYGLEGFNHTKTLLSEVGQVVGAGKWDEAYTPLILEKDDIKVGIMSLTEQQFGTLYNEEECKYGCAWVNHRSANKIVRDLKLKTDYVILLIHAGLEMLDAPLPEWRIRYRELIDEGADVIAGSHPHVVQGYEKYNRGLIFYSLGNFAFQSSKKMDDRWWNGGLLSLEIDNKEVKPTVYGTHFDNTNLQLLPNEEWSQSFKSLNNIINKETYSDYVDSKCLDRLPEYHNLFAMGGAIFPDRMILKNIARWFLGRCNSLHLLNNLQCESHRWCISRALRVKYNK